MRTMGLLRCSMLLTALGIVSCTSLASSGLQPANANAFVRSIRVDKRGVVKLFNDPEGDPLPSGITQGPDRAVWFTDIGNGIVGRVTGSGKYTLQQIVGGVSDGITVGPDQNLWFTVGNGGGGVGRITTSGDFSIFKDPGGSYTQGITTGPDGALWFAESNGTVGRITTAGKVTHFAVATRNAQLEGIVTGPDGNLWVTEYVVGGSRFSSYVIRLSTNGKYKMFKVGDQRYGAGPDQICVGPDKALWFTEADDNALGRLTTAGKYTEFPTNYPYVQPSGIATGPDDALWFTDFGGSAGIGRMTTSGKATFYHVPGSLPRAVEITAGPKNAMWFTTQLGPSAIGRVTIR